MSAANVEHELARFDSEQQPQQSQQPQVEQQEQQLQIQSNDSSNEIKKINDWCFFCGPLKWYFDPIFSKIRYSSGVMLFQLLNFILALVAFIFDVTGLAVAISLIVILCSGIVLYYFDSEIALLIARFDLWMTFYLVENDEKLLKKRSSNLIISLVNQMPSCFDCWNRFFCGPWWIRSVKNSTDNKNSTDSKNNNIEENNGNNLSFCGILFKRFVTIFTKCQMLTIHVYFLIIKPITVFLTCWTFFLPCYGLFLMITPIWYLADEQMFKKGRMCPLSYGACNANNECHCAGIPMNNFGWAIFVFFVGILILPLACRINNYSAYLSKIVTYYFLTQYFKYGISEQNREQQQLLYENTV